MDPKVLRQLDRLVLYTVAYITIFMILSLVLPYILPFVLGFIVALITQPIINYITRKIKIKRGISSFIIVLLVFAISVAIITLAISGIINEVISLSSVVSSYINKLMQNWDNIANVFTSYFHSIDPEIIDSIKNNIKGLTSQIFSGSLTVAKFIVNFAINLVKSLPNIIMVFIFALISSIYFAIDIPRLKVKIFSAFSREQGSRVKKLLIQSNKMILNYFKTYLIMISISFVETLIGTNILHLKYSLIISLITAISDALPILGPGTVLIPLGIGYILYKSYVKGIGILILYLIITVVRQILEPRIVSSSLGIYPLAILAAIFIGLKVHGFIGMIFAIFYVIFYVVLSKTGLFSDSPDEGKLPEAELKK